MILIGIDAGVHTGVAVWDTKRQRFAEVQTMKIHQAMAFVRRWQSVCKESETPLCVVFEDARQRKWYGGNAMQKMQGAGAVKRDSKIWEDFLTDCGIDFRMQPPCKGLTKWSAEAFFSVTKWEGRTSEHSRDAAMLVFGK